ncbi:MAG: calmodulin-binding protein [Planctomycetaceae bacterium]|jgi:hypothetical protein|nr:calmodulin-binding protein [Planctomycetia bacterium]PHY02178.1 MAG: calmodulin-binding protein [Planctomycetaceae bacterium]PHY02766.1 MAG: calmodulin-binding protein [Planctomycetaceae bacterium]RLS69139.1 MAG: calmodulin-binding protein [Planctomycetota bacterium]
MKWQFFAATAVLAGTVFLTATAVQAQPPSGGRQAYGKQWGSSSSSQDWSRFYHYPYVFYPHNFYADSYMQSANDLYHRYPQEMRVPVYNRAWQNDYPKSRRYHQGHHFNLDVF